MHNRKNAQLLSQSCMSDCPSLHWTVEDLMSHDSTQSLNDMEHLWPSQLLSYCGSSDKIHCVYTYGCWHMVWSKLSRRILSLGISMSWILMKSWHLRMENMIFTTCFQKSFDQKFSDLRCRAWGQNFPNVSREYDIEWMERNCWL